jgi:hypothetical protein
MLFLGRLSALAVAAVAAAASFLVSPAVAQLKNCPATSINSASEISKVTNCIAFDALNVTGRDITSLSFMSGIRNIEGTFIVRDTR